MAQSAGVLKYSWRATDNHCSYKGVLARDQNTDEKAGSSSAHGRLDSWRRYLWFSQRRSGPHMRGRWGRCPASDACKTCLPQDPCHAAPRRHSMARCSDIPSSGLPPRGRPRRRGMVDTALIVRSAVCRRAQRAARGSPSACGASGSGRRERNLKSEGRCAHRHASRAQASPWICLDRCSTPAVGAAGACSKKVARKLHELTKRKHGHCFMSLSFHGCRMLHCLHLVMVAPLLPSVAVSYCGCRSPWRPLPRRACRPGTSASRDATSTSFGSWAGSGTSRFSATSKLSTPRCRPAWPARGQRHSLGSCEGFVVIPKSSGVEQSPCLALWPPLVHTRTRAQAQAQTCAWGATRSILNCTGAPCPSRAYERACPACGGSWGPDVSSAPLLWITSR